MDYLDIFTVKNDFNDKFCVLRPPSPKIYSFSPSPFLGGIPWPSKTGAWPSSGRPVSVTKWSFIYSKWLPKDRSNYMQSDGMNLFSELCLREIIVCSSFRAVFYQYRINDRFFCKFRCSCKTGCRTILNMGLLHGHKLHIDGIIAHSKMSRLELWKCVGAGSAHCFRIWLSHRSHLSVFHSMFGWWRFPCLRDMQIPGATKTFHQLYAHMQDCTWIGTGERQYRAGCQRRGVSDHFGCQHVIQLFEEVSLFQSNISMTAY